MSRIVVLIVALALAGGAVVVALLQHEDVAAGNGHEHGEGAEAEEHPGAAEGEAPGHEGEAPGLEGEEHEHGAAGDLDRPLADLVAARCEHDRPTHQCAECRYEVGFVRVPADVLAAGLVRTAPVTERAVGAAVTLTGEIRHDERRIAHVTPVVEGVIREVHVGLMDAVTAGQPLLTLESAALGDAESAWLEARALVRIEQRNHKRAKELRDRRIASEKEFLAARSDLDQAELRAQAARGRLVRLGLGDEDLAALERGRALGRLVIRAPLAGRILDLHAVPGEVVGPAESVLLVGDVRRLWLWVDVYERDLAPVLRQMGAGGLAAGVAVEAFPDEVFRGAVDIAGGVMSEDTRTVPLRIVLENPDERLRPGMFATARLALAEAPRTLAVPAAAVLSDEGRDFVFVRHGAAPDGVDFVRRPVARGREEGGWVAVQGELGAGQEVVTDGAFLLKSDVLREKMGAGCAD